jgi:hypothetical protein
MRMLKNNRNQVVHSRGVSSDVREFDTERTTIYGRISSKRGRRVRRRRFIVDNYGINSMSGLVNGELLSIDSCSPLAKGYDVYDFL